MSIFSQIEEGKEINKQLGVFYQIYKNETSEGGFGTNIMVSEIKYKYSNGYSVGIIYTFQNSKKSNYFKRFRFETGLLFSKLDDKTVTVQNYIPYTSFTNTAPPSTTSSTERTLIELIEIPLKLNLLIVNSKRFNFYITTGLNSGYRTATTSNNGYIYKDKTSGFVNYSFGIGLELKFGKFISLNVEPNWRYLDNFNTILDNFNTGVNLSLRYNFF